MNNKPFVEKEELFNMLNSQFLLRVVPFRTTAENFSKYFYDTLSKKYNVEGVAIYETPNNCAVYSCK